MAFLFALVVACFGRHARGLSAVCWGAISEPSCRDVQLQETTDIFSTAHHFVALDKQSGLVQIWGADDALTSMVLPGVTEVYTTQDVVLLWNPETRETIFWGNYLVYNKRSRRSFSSYTSLYTTSGAILFLSMETGESLCMGDVATGGRCDHLNLTGVTEVYSTRDSFLAFDRSRGVLHCWGAVEDWGGCPGAVANAEDLTIHASGSAFLALNRRTGEASCWGDPHGGGDCRGRDLSGVTEVHSNTWAFLALNAKTGEAQCWGLEDAGGSCAGLNLAGTTDVYSTWGAFVALNRNSGEAQCWGMNSSGGNCSGLDFRGVTGVFGAREAFVALRGAGGAAECWGSPDWGGDCSGLRLRGASRVYSTEFSFLALAPSLAQPRPAPPWASWGRALLALAGAAAVAAALAGLVCFRWREAAKARGWDRERPLPSRTATELSRLQLRSASLEEQAAALESKDGVGCLARRRRARAAKARDRMSKLLARAALQAAGGPEHWGMSVEQLIAFHSEHHGRMERYCQSHRLADDFLHVCLCDPCDHDHGAAACRPLTPGETPESLRPLPFNMHTVVEVLIKPMTRDHQGIMGYWAHPNKLQPQKVETFVSHCWNERFDDLVATLRTLRHDTVVWVCSVDVSRSPFARALGQAERVLLAVDDALEPLTRSWCCFELHLAVAKEKRLDIRAPVTSPGLYQAISKKAALMDIRHCAATNASDHRAIMRALKGAEDAVNRRVRQHVEDTVQFITSFVP